MRVVFSFKRVDSAQKPVIREYFLEQARRFERLVKTYSEETVHLRLTVRGAAEGRPPWEVRGVLSMPTGTLACESHSEREVELALDDLADELHRMLRRHRSRMRRSSTRNAQVRRDLAAAIPFLSDDVAHDRREEFFLFLRPQLASLVTVATRELRIRELNGAIPENYLEPEEIVDETVIRAWQTFSVRGDSELGGWLTRILYEVLHDSVERVKHSRKPIDLSDLPIDDESIAGADLEDLLWEDVLPDGRVQDPLATLTREEERDAILSALLEVPEQDRVAFTLCELDGYATDEVAELQRRDTDAVEQSLERVRDRLIHEFDRAAT